VKERLNPGGVVTQWVPLYESTEDVVRSEIATFLEVFPNGTIWRNDARNGGYDVVLVGRLEETPIDVDAWQAKIDSPEYEAVKASLADVGYVTILDVLKTYSGRGKGSWAHGLRAQRSTPTRTCVFSTSPPSVSTTTLVPRSVIPCCATEHFLKISSRARNRVSIRFGPR
jgi:spermidine synthase